LLVLCWLICLFVVFYCVVGFVANWCLCVVIAVLCGTVFV